MLRIIGGTLAGAIGWFVIVSVLDLGLRHGWHDYAVVEKAMTFTLPMMIARLCESGLSSIASGALAAWVGRDRRTATYSGALLLIVFAPFHYTIWSKFPVWYHLTFLTSLVVLSVAGGWLLWSGKARGQRLSY